MTTLHSHVPTLLLATDLQAGLGNRPMPQSPSGGDDSQMALFEQLVLSIKKSNAMKKQLNAYCQQCRIDLDDIEVVFDDEQEDPMPNIMNFLGLPQAVGSGTGLCPSAVPPDPYLPSHTGSVLPEMPSPQSPGATTFHIPQQNLVTAVPCILAMSPSSPDLVWANVLADVQCLTAPNSAMPTVLKLGMNWDALGPAFLDVDTRKNEHELNLTGIPDALWMMIHLKLFISLSMLTTSSLSCICFDDNLKFKKIPFWNVASKYALDEAHFLLEDSLTDTEYLQAHNHWLTLMKVSAEPSIYNGWKVHHDRMCDDLDMLKWSWAWRSHDKQLHASFIDCPFIIDLESMTY